MRRQKSENLMEQVARSTVTRGQQQNKRKPLCLNANSLIDDGRIHYQAESWHYTNVKFNKKLCLLLKKWLILDIIVQKETKQVVFSVDISWPHMKMNQSPMA
jgi:hypothetical protein